MGVTTSRDRNAARYKLYEDHAKIKVNSLVLYKQSLLPLTSPAPHESAPSQVGHGVKKQCITASRTVEEPDELVFDSSSDSITDDFNANHGRAPQAAGAGVVNSDCVELAWICDPTARFKTTRTSFLRVAVQEGEKTTIKFNLSLVLDALRSSTLSLAFANSPEDLDRILLERKRGNVSLLTYSRSYTLLAEYDTFSSSSSIILPSPSYKISQMRQAVYNSNGRFPTHSSTLAHMVPVILLYVHRKAHHTPHPDLVSLRYCAMYLKSIHSRC